MPLCAISRSPWTTALSTVRRQYCRKVLARSSNKNDGTRLLWDGSTSLLHANDQQAGCKPQSLVASSSALLCSSLLSLQPSSEPPSVLLALGALVGLPLALWAYKCLMMVSFQRKIIYMGYVPPGARTENLGIDVPVPKEINCKEIRLQSEGRVILYGIALRKECVKSAARDPDVVVVYLQGNAGNPLARIPVFEKLFEGITSAKLRKGEKQLDLCALAVAPRSYWKSSSRTPTQRGLLADYTRVLSHATERYPKSSIVLYGHSLGGAIAVCLADQLRSADYPNVKGLVLENPFSSIPEMVQALYPQRWLPYRYLAPLAFDKWDAVGAMRSLADRPDSLLARISKDMLVLLSEKDEVVPPEMGMELYKVGDLSSHERGMRRQVIIRGALHERAWTERQWQKEMATYLREIKRVAT